MSTQHFVAYCDGSAKPNRGFAGFGVYGYTYTQATRPKNIKYPIHANLYFTSTGLHTDKGDVSIEVLRIVEIIEAMSNPRSSNNDAELQAFITTLRKAATIEDLATLTVYTDSNYVVTSFNEDLDRWKVNNWKRLDNKTIVHIEEWRTIDEYKQYFKELNITVSVVWVKGHADNNGNNIADLYSVIGSNSARRQLSIETETFTGSILNSDMSYAEYKQSYANKDFILHFRDLYFSSNHLDDTNYCFLSTSDDPKETGIRNTASIFISNIGYVPSFINRLKYIYRTLPRNYTTTCCIKLNKLENKEVYRLINLINPEDMLVKIKVGYTVSYSLIRDTTPFIFENTMDYPFIINASKLFTRMLDVNTQVNTNNTDCILIKDITNHIVQEGKVVFSNKDKVLDFTSLVENDIILKQKLLVTVGYDIPNYLSLKNIEDQIQSVQLVLETKPDNNFCTLYINIRTNDRTIYSVNIENKFLRSSLKLTPKEL